MSFTSFLKKLRPFSLMIAIFSGLLVFLMFHFIDALNPLKPAAYAVSKSLPYVLFTILFLAFIKIKFKEMKPRAWHLINVIFQVASCATIALYIHYFDVVDDSLILLGLMVAFITPTAASASVITGKLGGNESTLTTYIMLSNLAAAIFIPIIFPLVSKQDLPFIDEFLKISFKVFPMIVFPLVTAIVIRVFFKKLHQFLLTHTKDLGFYLWAFIIFVLSAQTFAYVAHAQCSNQTLILMALVSMICSICMFALGKLIGQFEKQRISSGQALGQKNNLFGIWVAVSFLDPTTSILSGGLILWQNVINAYQMWYRERLVNKSKAQGVEPYQE